MGFWDYFFRHTSLIRHFDYKMLNQFLELNENDTVLDIGCGDGFYLSKSFPNKLHPNIVGVDLKAENLIKAKQNRELKKAEFICADAGSLPIKGNYFNKVYSNSSIEHFQDDETFLAEVNRILPEGGLFALTTDAVHQGPTALTKFIYLITPDFLKDKEVKEITGKGVSLKNALVERHKRMHSVKSFYDSSKLTAKLRKNGFAVIDSRYYFNGLFSKMFNEISICTRFRIVGNGLLGRLFFPLWYLISLAESNLISPEKKGYFLAVKAVK